MRKSACIIILCMLCGALYAQSRLSYSIEYNLGYGLGKGPLTSVGTTLVLQYDLGADLNAGAGIGWRIALPCFQYTTTNGSATKKNYCMDFDVPLFVRLGYSTGYFFTNVDAGYAIGLIGLYIQGLLPGDLKDTAYSGLFIEPQIGWNINKKRSLAIGCLIQHSIVHNVEITREEGSIYRHSWPEGLYTPTLTLRYSQRF